MKSFSKPLTESEEKYYLERYRRGGSESEEARNILVEHNMRLVAHIARKYQKNNCSIHDSEDMISVGTIGLIKAVNNFDESKGRLSAYASKCIENEILMMFRSEKKHSRDIMLFDSMGKDKEGKDIAIIDTVKNKDRDVEEEYELRENIRKMYKLINEVLTKKEKYIIINRYGLFGCEEKTQRELAGKLGISRSYVSRIEKRAFEKMRRYLI